MKWSSNGPMEGIQIIIQRTNGMVIQWTFNARDTDGYPMD